MQDGAKALSFLLPAQQHEKIKPYCANFPKYDIIYFVKEVRRAGDVKPCRIRGNAPILINRTGRLIHKSILSEERQIRAPAGAYFQ